MKGLKGEWINATDGYETEEQAFSAKIQLKIKRVGRLRIKKIKTPK